MSVRQQVTPISITRRAVTLTIAGTAALAFAAALPTTAAAADDAVAAVAAATPSRAAALRTVQVTSIAELAAAAADARPGDRIMLADGTYTLRTNVALTSSGTPLNRVVIAAENIGKVVVRGTGGFKIMASHLVIEGFTFANSAELRIPATQHHVRLTRNTFQLAPSVKNWVTVSGDDCEIDHNTFTSKKTVGVFLMVAGPGLNGMAKRAHIHHNYFKDHTYAGANGGENIRVGLSTRQHGSAAAVVEDNLLDNPDGDPEAISVKSSDNIIRHNVLRGGRGTITLRHGSHNTVDGNVLTGGSTGIRAFGDDHVIINNVVQDTDREQLVEIGGGDIRTDTAGTSAHEAADRVLVAFNTLVTGTSNNAVLIGSARYKQAPDSITVANNILGGAHGTAEVISGTHLAWRGNIQTVAGPAVPTAGNRVVDPQLVKVDGIYRITATSPAIGAATGRYEEVTVDLDGQARPLVRATVGADQYTDGGARRTVGNTRTGPDGN